MHSILLIILMVNNNGRNKNNNWKNFIGAYFNVFSFEIDGEETSISDEYV